MERVILSGEWMGAVIVHLDQFVSICKGMCPERMIIYQRITLLSYREGRLTLLGKGECGHVLKQLLLSLQSVMLVFNELLKSGYVCLYIQTDTSTNVHTYRPQYIKALNKGIQLRLISCTKKAKQDVNLVYYSM